MATSRSVVSVGSLLSRQPVRESAHPAARGVFHPDAAGWAPVPVPVGARDSLLVSNSVQPRRGVQALPEARTELRANAPQVH